MGMSLVTARPTTRVRPCCRSIDCSPEVESSLNIGREYTSVPGASQRQRPQHRLRLLLRLGELARRVRVGYDACARLHDHAVLERHRRAQADRRVEIHRAPADVAYRPGVGPAPLGFEL